MSTAKLVVRGFLEDLQDWVIEDLTEYVPGENFIITQRPMLLWDLEGLAQDKILLCAFEERASGTRSSRFASHQERVIRFVRLGTSPNDAVTEASKVFESIYNRKRFSTANFTAALRGEPVWPHLIDRARDGTSAAEFVVAFVAVNK